MFLFTENRELSIDLPRLICVQHPGRRSASQAIKIAGRWRWRPRHCDYEKRHATATWKTPGWLWQSNGKLPEVKQNEVPNRTPYP